MDTNTNIRIVPRSPFTRALDAYYRILKIALTGIMGLMIVPVSLQVLSRLGNWIPHYIWTEEVARFCFVWIVMIGSIIAVRDGSHFDVDLLPRSKTERRRGLLSLIKHLAMLAMAFVFAVYGMEFAKFGFRQNSEMSEINMLSIYISFPIAGFSWILFLSEKLLHDIKLIASSKSEASP